MPTVAGFESGEKCVADMLALVRIAKKKSADRDADIVFVPEKWRKPLMQHAQEVLDNSIGSDNQINQLREITHLFGTAVVFTAWIDEPIGMTFDYDLAGKQLFAVDNPCEQSASLNSPGTISRRSPMSAAATPSIPELVAAFLRHRDDFAKVYEIGTELFASKDVATAMSLTGDLLKAIAPIIKDLLGQGSTPPEGVMQSDTPPVEVCAAIGWDLSTVEKIAQLVLQILPLFLV